MKCLIINNMKRFLVSMRIMQWVLAAALIISGLGMLSSCEKFEEANHDILCQWICDRAEEGISARTGLEYNRVVEVYEFFDNGTGYYECYLLNGDELLSANYVRGENGNFRYDVKGDLDLRSTVAKKNAHICLDLTIFLLDRSWTPWTVRYADGLITDGEGGVFTPATEAQREQILQLYESRNVTGLSEKIIGKWMPADIDGKPALTNEKMVFAFLSPTKGYISASLSIHSDAEMWSSQLETDVAISGNKVTVTFHPDEHNTSVHELNITAINDKEFTANQKVTVTIDGNVVISEEKAFRYVKLTADYSADILGLWECTGLTGIETYNDANARLEFLADGTYRYYRLADGGQWQAVTTREFQDYFVDGTLLATRWKNQGDAELREWWEIASLADGQMQWTALRQNSDGTTAQQGMTWKKIDLNVAEKIIGKWIIADMNGKPATTNEKVVFTFVSPTKAFISASLNTHPEVSELWATQTENDVAINGNKMTLTSHPNQHETVVDELNVTAIDGSEFTANRKLTVTVDGNVAVSIEEAVRFVKVTADYSAAIVGTWEGQVTSTQDTYGDGKEHRWEYKTDGNFVYYVKDGDNWVPSANTLNEYFVDGNLLCMRWIDNDVEYREWWEIAIDGDTMNWTALRQNPDGTTFTSTFSMSKVE